MGLCLNHNQLSGEVQMRIKLIQANKAKGMTRIENDCLIIMIKNVDVATLLDYSRSLYLVSRKLETRKLQVTPGTGIWKYYRQLVQTLTWKNDDQQSILY
jgi:hypothetical protein